MSNYLSIYLRMFYTEQRCVIAASLSKLGMQQCAIYDRRAYFDIHH
jgi:hypothetical protein